MDDKDLHARFAELRDEERRLVPPFEVRTRAKIRWRALATAAAAALLLIIVVTIAIRPRPARFSDADRAAARAVAEWQAPTDSLLQTPGSELLTTTPRIPDLKGITQ